MRPFYLYFAACHVLSAVLCLTNIYVYIYIIDPKLWAIVDIDNDTFKVMGNCCYR